MSDIRDFAFRDMVAQVDQNCEPSFWFRDMPATLSPNVAFNFRDYGDTIPAQPCTAEDFDFWASPDGDGWESPPDPDGETWEAIPDP